MHQPASQRIVILGAGFGGVAAARMLARRLPRDGCQITLVDQRTFLLFTPMLTELVGGKVLADDIVNAVRRLSPAVRFEHARVEDVELAQKRVRVTRGGGQTGLPEEQVTLAADHLVIALGSVTNFHQVSGVREHALTVKSVSEAALIRNRALETVAYAATEQDSEKRRRLLTFVVAGGGFSGVETMAALNDLVRATAKSYGGLDASEIRCMLIYPGKRLLPELSEDLGRYAERKIQQRGVTVVPRTKITGASADTVELEGGRRINAHLFIWTAGVTPSPLVERLDCERGAHGGIVVDACGAVRGRSGVWALGDCAEMPMPGGAGKTYAPTAQNATRAGRQVARNIAATLRGKPPRPFVYTPLGELALVGEHAGVANVRGVRLSGMPAWALWRGVYLAKTPRLSKRIRVGLDWLLDALAGREIAELPLASSHAE
jgi:NADH dehydrogenase